MLQLGVLRQITEVAELLPRFIRALHSREIREHPEWGKVIPFQLEGFGNGLSCGYRKRLDMVIGPEGVRVVEIGDCSAGAGLITTALDQEERRLFLHPFARWYARLLELSGASQIVYAVGSNSYWEREIAFFAEALHGATEFQIRTGNIDELDPKDALVERLFMRAQTRGTRGFDPVDIFPRESWVDSKASLAVVHDPSVEAFLQARLGVEGLAVLRRAIPLTFIPRSEDAETLADQKNRFVVKSTDVEAMHTFGARGVYPGKSMKREQFRSIVAGGEAKLQAEMQLRKNFGAHPMLQELIPSRSFYREWCVARAGQIRVCDSERFGFRPFKAPAKDGEVFARIVAFVLITMSEEGDTTSVVPIGGLTLRQDRIVHGASDALSLPLRFV